MRSLPPAPRRAHPNITTMRPHQVLGWTALVLGLLCKVATVAAGADEVTLYSDTLEDHALVEVSHQRALTQTASPRPAYQACALQSVRSSIRVNLRLNVRPVINARRRTVKSRASFAVGKSVLAVVINGVYPRYKRPVFKARNISGPKGQGSSVGPKWFTYTFTLPIGRCGADKRRLISALRKALVGMDALKKVKGSRIGGAKLSVFA